jgi:hypothetical protein
MPMSKFHFTHEGSTNCSTNCISRAQGTRKYRRSEETFATIRLLFQKSPLNWAVPTGNGHIEEEHGQLKRKKNVQRHSLRLIPMDQHHFWPNFSLDTIFKQETLGRLCPLPACPPIPAYHVFFYILTHSKKCQFQSLDYKKNSAKLLN